MMRRDSIEVTGAVTKGIMTRKRSLPKDEVAPSKKRNATRKKNTLSESERCRVPSRRRAPTNSTHDNPDLFEHPTKRQKVSR